MGIDHPMRDWIGTGISLLGLLIVVVALVRTMRARARRSPDVSGQSAVPLRPDKRRALFELCGGLLVVEVGQLVRAHGWIWAVLHLIAIGFIAATALMMYRDRRRRSTSPISSG